MKLLLKIAELEIQSLHVPGYTYGLKTGVCVRILLSIEQGT